MAAVEGARNAGRAATVRTALRRVDRLTLAASAWAVLLVVGSVLALWLPIGSTTSIAVGPRLGSPSAAFLFGTDDLGRSLLPRVVEGVRTTFLLALVSVIFTTFVGTLIGMLAGYLRGKLDAAVSRLTEVLFAFPAILLALLLTVVLGYGKLAAVVSIVLVSSPLMIRVVRAATLVVSERDFVTAARVGGASIPRVLVVHLAPNIGGAVATQATYAMSLSMLIESSLSFLGLGIQPPGASLGSLVRDGSAYLTVAPWLVFIPGLFLASAICAVNLIGDGVRDALDRRSPRALQ